MSNRYYWNKDTLKLFKDLIELGDDFETIKEQVTLFVQRDCTLENNETEEMLINDLIKQIYNYEK
tara:strand:- start:247 stop:441 length:195 start_codon:yes stop_codon:yes gene_type:complete